MGFWADVGKWVVGGVAVVIGVATFGVGFAIAAGIGAAVTIAGAAYEGIKAINDALSRAGNVPEQEFQSRKVMARGADTPRKIIYGEVRTGGQLVFFESTGTDSQFMHMIVVLAPHPVEGIGEVYFADELAFNATGTPQGSYAGEVEVIKELGNQTTANATIVSRLPEWTDDHKLLGCAYVYVRLEYNRDLFSRGLPDLSAVVRGKNTIYDPRTETTGYTDNHALCVLDYLQAFDGFRVEDDEVDMQSFIDAANISDEQVPAATGTEKRYTVNGDISLAASPLDNLSSLSRAGAAMVTYSQGVFRIVPGSYSEPPAEFSFDESDFVGGLSFNTGPGKANMVNTGKGTYLDPRQDYEPVSFPQIQPSTYVARDGEVLETEFKMPFANSPTLARRLAKIAIEKERYGISANVTLNYSAASVDVGDRITISNDRVGWDQKVFRVEEADLTVQTGVRLRIREDGPQVWNWTEGEAIDVTPPPALTLPDRTAMAAPTDLQVQERLNTPNTLLGDRSTLFLTVTPPDDDRYAYTRFQYRLKGQSQWVDIDYSNSESAAVTVQSVGATFEIRAQAVSQVGRVSPLAAETEYTVFDIFSEDAQDALRLPEVYGLSLDNRVAPNTFDQFKSGNAEFSWQGRTASLTFDNFDETETGLDSEGRDPYFRDYQITIRGANGGVRRVAYRTDESYVYTLEDNRRDGTGRSFEIEVVARGNNGQIGKAETLSVENPAPAAPSNVSIALGHTSFHVEFTPPDDIDFVGFDFFVIEGGGDPYASEARRLRGNSVTEDGLIPGSTYTIGLRSVDQFGDGNQISALSLTTRKIDATELGDITSPLTLDENGGRIITNNNGYIAVHGAHSAPDESEFPLIFSANDGVTYSFWVDAAGNAKFAGELSAASGSIENIEATNLNVLGNSVFGDIETDEWIQLSGAGIEFGPGISVQRSPVAGTEFDNLTWSENGASTSVATIPVTITVAVCAICTFRPDRQLGNNIGLKFAPANQSSEFTGLNSVRGRELIKLGELINLLFIGNGNRWNDNEYMPFSSKTGVGVQAGNFNNDYTGLVYNVFNPSTRRYVAIASGTIRLDLALERNEDETLGYVDCYVGVFVNGLMVEEFSATGAGPSDFPVERTGFNTILSITTGDLIDISIKSDSTASTRWPLGSVTAIRFRTQNQVRAVLPASVP